VFKLKALCQQLVPRRLLHLVRRQDDSNERSVSSSTDFAETSTASTAWGPSAFDVEHRIVASFGWQLPLNFMVSAIGTYQTGYRFTALDGRDNNGDFYFNERALVETSPGVYYHYPRNSFTQPDRKNIDMRLSWTARFGGDFELELIGEVFNLLNEENFWSSNDRLVESNGTINRTSTRSPTPACRGAADRRQVPVLMSIERLAGPSGPLFFPARASRECPLRHMESQGPDPRLVPRPLPSPDGADGGLGVESDVRRGS
jgi:hypothetical protein